MSTASSNILKLGIFSHVIQVHHGGLIQYSGGA